MYKKREENDKSDLAVSDTPSVSSTGESNETDATIFYDDESNYSPIESTEVSIKDEEVVVETCALSDEQMEGLISSIDSIESFYNYDYYYPSDEKIETLFDEMATTKECDYVFNNDPQELLNTLKKNSADFVLENPNYVSEDVCTLKDYKIVLSYEDASYENSVTAASTNFEKKQ